MTWVAIGVGVASLAIGQIIRIATAPSQLKTQTNVTEDQSDTGVSSGRYGDPISVFWGSGRAPGNLIWAKEIREQVDVTSETVTQSGGKGGGGGAATTTTTTKYSYFGTFAVEICANEIVGISKIWLNSKLFYENRPFLLGTPLSASQEAQQYFTVYTGKATQAQDPTIVATLGAALTPSYTNRAIIVFKELPLLDFGNRFPVVEVIYHQDGSGDNLHTVAGAPTKLHKIIGYLSEATGLLPSQIDATELTDDVEGFQMPQRGNAQGFLRELAQVYHFGCIDTGQKLKFVSHPVPVYREEYEQNCIINEDFLIVNSYHDVLGRSGYFPSSCGTSEGQFAQIIAAIRAYQATSDTYWRDLALAMAGVLNQLYFAEPPASPSTLYTPHWLFNVKRNIQLQSSVLTAKITFVLQGDGTYLGIVPPGPGFYGELLTKVTRAYDNTHSYLVWKNPYSGVRGTAYTLPKVLVTNSSGTQLQYPVGTTFPTGQTINLAYIINAGKMLGVGEMMEAWPNWRELEGGEIDCAVDTLAWALEAFDLLYGMTSDSKWLNAYNATAATIASVYSVDDGRWWVKKAKGSAFVLSGTYLAADGAPFADGQITRNKDLTLEFAVTEDGSFSGVTPLPLATLQTYWYGASSAATSTVVNTYASTEIQFGRGINDVIRAGDTHIRLIAKSSSSTMICRVILQDKDDDLLTTFRWYSDLTLSTTMTTYDLPLAGFKKMQYPFNGSTNLLGTGISVGQVIKVAGIIFYPTQTCNITVEALRPIPEIVLPYTPSIAPYTANSIGGQILDWSGGPGIGYQNCYAWAKIGNATKLGVQVGFLSDSQAAYTATYGVVGPFKPAYVWDRYDVLEIGGTPNTWQWEWPDPNSEWVGYTARCVEGLGHGAYIASNTTARTLCGNFLTWLNTYWTNTAHYIPTNYPQSITARANSTAYAAEALIRPVTENGFVYRANNAGTSGASIPTYTTTIGATFTDGGITWRCQGYRYGPSPIYGEYNEPHAAALFLRAACWYRLAGGTTSLADAIIVKCWNYMESLVVSSGDMAGTWSPNVSGKEWWGFWGAEIITTLSLLLTTFDTIRTANGISSTTIQTRISNYKFWLFTNTRTITIPDIDDIVTKEGYNVSTIQDVELPNEISIKYKNLKNSGEGEARYFRKQSGYSDASVNLSLNMTLTAEQAGTLPKTLVGEFWSQRDVWEFQTRSFTAQPMDCVEFMVDGEVKRLLYKNVELTPDGVSKITAVSYDPTVYRISSPTPSEGVSSVVSLSYPPQTIVTILNLPAMSPADNSPGYASGASAGTDKWQGGSLTASNDGGLSFTGEASYGARMTAGTITEVLPANRTTIIDRSMQLTVTLEYGQIESITEAQLLNQGNIALMGTEIICFQNATLISPNVYKIDGFLRGQFGTEDQIYSHGAGEKFILINGAISKTAISQSLLNVSRKGRAYTSGRPTTDFYEFDFTATGYNLLPWAPVNITSNRGTDLLLGWTRRDRINNGWGDDVDIPLNESIEQYRVDLLTNPLYLSGTIIASYFTNVESITITAAQITAAYGSSGATVHVAIRQMSSVVGAGKPLEGTF